ncbi:MAG: undecaprenyldiphospho-muramoylpentapeptide beta-N-acetylglucosaminyltransferase [Spirochaetes bacterium]|nr:undecaprenyldiphospho-muramoylpentapeptide beta-N-acetylglucosaminyltransferase [Spirochaetota bacterium]
MKKQYKFIITAGGTGGHILPGLSIYQLLKRDDHRVKFICRKKDYNFIKDLRSIRKDLVFFSGIGFRRRIDLRNILFIYHLVINILRSFILFCRYYPDAVISMGGYITFPVLFTSVLLGIPFFICEQNSYPGMVNRIFKDRAKKVFVNFEYSKKIFKNAIVTGNPIRGELKKKISVKEAYSFFKFKKKRKVLLIMGGSQGSLKINSVFRNTLPLLDRYNIIWLVGKANYDQFKKYKKDNVRIFGYLKEMTYVYTVADLAICRAGAMSITELAYFGVPALFIPLPGSANDHQYLNARTIIRSGGGEMLEERRLEEEVLSEKIRRLLEKDVLLTKYKNNIKKFYRQESEDKIAKTIYLMIKT